MQNTVLPLVPMTITSILDTLPSIFSSHYWRQRPLVLRGALHSLEQLVTKEELNSYEDDYFSAPASWRTNSIGRIGSTSYIGNGECVNEQLAQLCSRFRQDFRWPHAEVAIVHNREATSWVPSGPHFDQVDNFITQIQGSKHWRLWPTGYVDKDEKRRRILREPHVGELALPIEPTDVLDVIVEPGDLLYLPLFWGHAVRALSPGIMLSINLKALLPSQVLLSGMSHHLSGLIEDDRPLPLPFEAGDWETSVARLLEDAFTGVAQRIAPTAQRNEANGTQVSAILTSGLVDIASHRHESLLRREVSNEPLQPSRHLKTIKHALETSRVDLRLLSSFPPVTGLSAVVDWLSATHLHRFFGLLSLGPQPWWSPNDRDSWAEFRERIENKEFDSLARAAFDPQLIEMTSQFRGNLLAFNRRHATATVRRWIDRLEQIAANGNPEFEVFTDAGCLLPAEGRVASLVHEGLRLVDKTWPNFSITFGQVIRHVASLRNGWQARQAGRRPLVAVVDADWSVEQAAVALVGELARVSTQVIERIGLVMPATRPLYQGSWTASPSEISRVTSLRATAAYKAQLGDSDGATVGNQLADALLRKEACRADLTPLGRELVAALAGSSDTPPRTLLSIIQELETFEAEDARELVEGNTNQFSRFRWSKLLSTSGSQPNDLVAGVGMDCDIPPWIVF